MVVPFPTMSVLLGIRKEQGVNLIGILFTCGPVPGTYEVVRTVSIHEPEPKLLTPVAISLPDASIKAVAFLEKARVVVMLANAASKTIPLLNTKD